MEGALSHFSELFKAPLPRLWIFWDENPILGEFGHLAKGLADPVSTGLTLEAPQ
jgi:hypothetical protein